MAEWQDSANTTTGGPSQLTTHHVYSVTLLVPPGLHWTLAALHHSPIASLTLCMSSYAVEPRYKLALTDVDTRSEADAFAFLARLPRLTDLNVIHPHPSGGLGTHKTKGPIPHLVHLVHLRAPTTVVEHLLSRAHRFPAIRTICVVWKPPRQADINGLIRPMSSIARRLSGRAVSPCLSLCIDSVSPVATAAVVMREMTTAQLAYVKGVEGIHLERGYYPVDDARRAIAQIIALFPRVEHVSFTTTRGVFPATAVPHFVHSVQATESLKNITVDGESYTLSNRIHDAALHPN
ncbi:hypothetical protein B0H13DRAFT_2368356 [Mycena leptocephala]|nr:hypothetical protein B0H13DRAFT_2368356 [Mycena leptocephala]